MFNVENADKLQTAIAKHIFIMKKKEGRLIEFRKFLASFDPEFPPPQDMIDFKLSKVGLDDIQEVEASIQHMKDIFTATEPIPDPVDEAVEPNL